MICCFSRAQTRQPKSIIEINRRRLSALPQIGRAAIAGRPRGGLRYAPASSRSACSVSVPFCSVSVPFCSGPDRLETGVHAVELPNGTKSFPQSRGGPRRSHRPRKNPSAVTDSRYKFQSRLELELDKTDQVHRSVILFVIGSEKFPSSASRFWRAFIPDFF